MASFWGLCLLFQTSPWPSDPLPWIGLFFGVDSSAIPETSSVPFSRVRPSVSHVQIKEGGLLEVVHPKRLKGHFGTWQSKQSDPSRTNP